MKQKKRINPAFYIMTVPMAVLFFCFHTFPFLQGVFYSFTDWKGYGNWNFVRAAKLSAYFSGQKCWIFVFVHV